MIQFLIKNILIESNSYDSDEVILQKIGRLGRRGFSGEDDVFTYCIFRAKPEGLDLKPIQKKKRKKYNFCNYFWCEAHEVPEIVKKPKKRLMLIYNYTISYNQIKYSKAFFDTFLNCSDAVQDMPKLAEYCKEAKAILLQEEAKIKSIIFENLTR